MGVLNKKTCLGSAGNTGVAPCFFDLKELRGEFIVPSSFTLTEEQLASKESVKEALEAATLAVASARIYPIHKFTGFENGSTDATVQTLGFGQEITLNDGKYKLTSSYLEGGMCLNKALRKFNNIGGLSVLMYDGAGQLVGWRDGNTLKGIPLDSLYAPKMDPNDYSATTLYRIGMVFDPVYLNDKFGIVEGGDFTFWQSISGIMDVALSATREANVITAKASSGCAEVSLYELYGSELAVAGAWVAKNATTGALITITTVAENAGAEGWTLTLNASDPDYSTSAVLISLAAPAALDAIDVSKYESNVISVAISGS